MPAAGKPVSDEDLITYLTNGLNPAYNGFITSFSIMTRDKNLSLDDFQDELLNHETLLNHQSKTVDTSTYALSLISQALANFIPRIVDPHSPSFLPETLTFDLKQRHMPPLQDTMQYHRLLGTQHLPDILPLTDLLSLACSLHLTTSFLCLLPLGYPAKYAAN